MESNQIETKSFRSIGSISSRISQITTWFSFGSRADDCVSNSSNMYRWQLFQARQQTQLLDYQDKLQEAIDSGDEKLIKYYQSKVNQFDDGFGDNLSYNQLDGDNRIDTMKAYGKHNRGSIPSYEK